LDEEQHQQAAGEVEQVQNSVTRNFRRFRWCNFGRMLNKQNCISSNSFMSVLYLYMSADYVCEILWAWVNVYKIAPRQSWRICDCLSVKIRVFVGVRFERRNDAKKANLHENW